MSDNFQAVSGLHGIVQEVESVAFAAAEEKALGDNELAQILAFLTKVSHIVEQAFRDVLDILIDIKFLRPQDLNSAHVDGLLRKVEVVLAISHYRDAEEICSRLKHLKETFHRDLAVYVERLPGRQGWSGLLGLIEEREGRIIMLIEHVLRAVQQRLTSVDKGNLSDLNQFAAVQANAIKLELNELTSFTNRILGLSGRPGLLEMVRDRTSRAAVIQEMSVLIDRRNNMTEHNYTASGGSVIVGQGATTGDIKLAQAWQNQTIDLSQLSKELSTLRQGMKAAATNPEHDVAIGHIAAAESAAKSSDEKATIEALKNAGKWALGMAENIGTGLATQALKTVLGL